MENNFDHIERFFNGTLNQDEIAEFEKRRSIDKEFDNEVILYRQALNVIRAGARNRMKQRLDEMGRSEETKTIVRSFTRNRQEFRYYAVAASVLVLAVVGYLAYNSILSPPSTPTLASLYDRYYEVPDADLAVTRGNDADVAAGTAWNMAIGKYNEHQYAEAINDFKALLANPSFTRTSTANFYLGICYLNMGYADSAVYSFNKVSQSSSLSQDADWYLGLGYLKAGAESHAERVFKEISQNQKHYKRKEARKILRKLSRKP